MRRTGPHQQRRDRRGESGQALVEFAIVLPLVILVFFFSQWLWEVIQIRFKAQEAARFVAWEATAYPLHDYKAGKANQFSSAQSAILTEAMALYTDLDSSRRNGITSRMWLASWQPPIITLQDGTPPVVPGGMVANLVAGAALNIVDYLDSLSFTSPNMIAEPMTQAALRDRTQAAKKWKFNTRGYVTARVRTRITNNWFNMSAGSHYHSGVFHNPTGEVAGMEIPTIWIRERLSLVADSWRLNDGNKVEGSGNTPGRVPGAGMYEQVNRMYLFNSKARAAVKPHITTYKTMARLILTAIGAEVDPTIDHLLEPTVVANPYTGAGGSGGTHQVYEDSRAPRYETAPNYGKYADALGQRGENFMGCTEPSKLGCTHTTSSDNPFGDYISLEDGS